MSKKDEYLTVNEAAQLSGYHPERIRELIREERINAQKFSIVWQVERASLVAYMTKMQKVGRKRGPKS